MPFAELEHPIQNASAEGLEERAHRLVEIIEQYLPPVTSPAK